jgi:hypothetical protein
MNNKITVTAQFVSNAKLGEDILLIFTIATTRTEAYLAAKICVLSIQWKDCDYIPLNDAIRVLDQIPGRPRTTSMGRRDMMKHCIEVVGLARCSFGGPS